MRSLRMLVLLAPLVALAACGRGEDRTVVVNPQPAPAAAPVAVPMGSTVVVPQSTTTTTTRICPRGMVTC